MVFDQRTTGGEGANHPQWASGARVTQVGAGYVPRPRGRYALEAFVEQRERMREAQREALARTWAFTLGGRAPRRSGVHDLCFSAITFVGVECVL